MTESTLKNFCLLEELRSAIKLISLGFGEFQNLNSVNDFYYLPFQLLSSGFERLMKCHICLGYLEKHKEYPDTNYLKKCGGKGGHDLLELKKVILNSYFSTHQIPALKDDLNLLTNNKNLKKLIYLLSEFGKYARYYNFDIVTSAAKPSVDVQQLWKKYEDDLIGSEPETLRKLLNWETSEEVIADMRQKILIQLEQFVRAICRQFTMGKLGKQALQFSSVLYEFILFNDDELGIRDYRVSTTKYQQTERKVHKRTSKDEYERKFNPNYYHQIIRRREFNGDWPFYHDEIIIECREKYWCIVTIENKDYALNGSAAGRYKLENVHDAGMAILGKSVGVFISMALKLGEEI